MKLWFLAFAGVLFFSLAAQAANTDQDEDSEVESVTILASTSLAIPIAEISKTYSRLTDTDINAVYDASGELVRKIKEGDPADIVITPSLSYIEEMKKEGLLDPLSVKIIAGNGLSLVAAKEMKIEKSDDIKNTFKQIHNKALMVISDPENTSLGNFSRQTLENLGLWQGFEKMVVRAPTATKAVDFIIKDQSAGIVYTTDAILYASQLQDLGRIPDNSHTPINYYAAIVIGADTEKAQKYLDYLNSPPAKNILKTNGFSLP